VEVLAVDGSLLSVSGRGDLNADPDVVVIGGRRRRVVAWAGPWPLLDRWWDRRGRRRLARLQVVLDDGSAHLLAVEQRRWSLMGTHD
jgi:protein ImuB